MRLQTRINIQSTTTALGGSPSAISQPRDFTDIPISFYWDTGTAADQANLVYRATGSISASGTLNIDLTSGLVDVFGGVAVFARVKMLLIQNTGTVDISPTGTFLAFGGGQFTIQPGGAYCIVAPDATAYVVTNGVSDTIQIDNLSASTTATYTIVIIGTAS
jgi:hypothetical protein